MLAFLPRNELNYRRYGITRRVRRLSPSQLHSGVRIRGEAEAVHLFEDLGEEVEKLLEALHVADHSRHLEVELVHSVRKARAVEALVVLELQADLRLLLDQAPDLRVGEQGLDLGLVVALDDEIVVELAGVTHLDVLHAQHLAQAAEDALAVDPEAELVLADEGRPHAGKGHVVMTARYAVDVQGDRPALDVSLDLVSFPEAAVDEVGPDF